MSSRNDRNEFRGFSEKTKILKRGREKNREQNKTWARKVPDEG